MKINFDRVRYQILLKKTIADANKEFITRLKIDNIKNKIYNLILSGISPVGSVIKTNKKKVSKAMPRRFQKYSKSYKDYLMGKVKFVTIKNKVVPISPSPDGPISWKNPTKVNLFFYGDMLNSLYAKVSGSVLKVGFTDKKAFYHNNEGVGKDKIKRRLLPTESGEDFTPTIDIVIKKTGEKSISKAFLKNKNLLKLRIKLKPKS